MGGFDPVSAAAFALNTINQQRQAKIQERAAQASADGQIARLRQQQQIRERQRQEQLKRAQATQRARFGAGGLGAGGSADAVLDGLGAAAARAGADEGVAFDERISDINGGVDALRRRNLLERRNMVQDRIYGEITKRLPFGSLLEK